MSVFTYDPDPPRVSSPWSKSVGSLSSGLPSQGSDRQKSGTLGGLPLPALTRLEDHDIAYLDAEPEAGPVEYKLHLLLRPRQHFAYTSTGEPNTDPRARPTAAPVPAANDAKVTLPSSVPSHHSRQIRLQHLTTQLLWRLQQSSPYHASSTASITIPSLPDVSEENPVAPMPGKLLPGIEESQGAMYEIGVNDDGALIGLTRKEMSESLFNLRAMAASLGSNVRIVRAVIVGSCQLAAAISSSVPTNASVGKSTEDLIVVEALVLPNTAETPRRKDDSVGKSTQDTEQLRVSLTGSTTSGKSSLLGTLLASTLDNARGKSRLNLLKHRHEIASGVTSSVAHELLGYEREDKVVNYACKTVDTWTDVHNRANGGRLVLLTDSAGHPRFRRTIVRSLVAWQPHWTLCCVAASYDQDAAQALAIAHLELCLKLGLPLVVVITKLDLATNHGLRHILSMVLDKLKAVGRLPQLLKLPGKELDLQAIPGYQMHEIRTQLESVQSRVESFVPILLTSAVTGAGMTKLHALLRQLPILEKAPSEDTSSDTLFNVDEIFIKEGEASSQTYILSGLLHRGRLCIGDELLLGPFSETFWTTDPRPPLDGRRAASYPVTEHEMATRRSQVRSGGIDGDSGIEWYKVRITSLRNLRLPVQTSFEGQAATVGVTFHGTVPSMRPRKGMVLLQGSTHACSAFQALFDVDAYSVMEPGARFFVYVASIRAHVKVVTVGVGAQEHDHMFELEEANAESDANGKIEVMFQLLSSREYMEMGAKALVMPEQAGGGGTGLEGYAGVINAVFLGEGVASSST